MKNTFLDDFDMFKQYMSSCEVPNYIGRYCSQLDEKQWKWFYSQIMLAFLVTDESEYLFYFFD